MPVPVSPPTPVPLFPPLSREAVDASRTAAWHELFEDVAGPAAVIDIDALGERDAFLHWLDSESIFLPEDAGGETSPDAPVYRLPKLNAAIRAAVAEHGAVFPKLNWTAPRDAAFLLPQGHGPLHCTTPADVYLLLKSSDFVSHGLGERAYEGTEEEGTEEEGAEGAPEAEPQVDKVPKLELVLKKYLPELNPAREVRCFVRDNILLGISQRDMNYYDHLQARDAQQRIVDSVRAFWEDDVRGHYEGGPDYVFDLYLGENAEPTLIDFQPYRASTDPLLFSYSELQQLLQQARAQRTNSAGDPVEPSGASPAPARLPVLRVVDSAAHPAASRAAPTFSTNMMPLEMLQMSEGRTLAEFAQAWEEAMNQQGGETDSDDDDE